MGSFVKTLMSCFKYENIIISRIQAEEIYKEHIFPQYLKSNNTYGTATEMRISLNKFYKKSNAVPEIKNTQKESIVVAKENVKSQVTTSESLELSDVINIHFTTLSKTVLEKVSFANNELKQSILNTFKESQIALIKQLSDGISTISKSTEDFEEEYQAILQELHKENVIMK
jgi:transcriptional regulator of NAD metabolism